LVEEVQTQEKGQGEQIYPAGQQVNKETTGKEKLKRRVRVPGIGGVTVR